MAAQQGISFRRVHGRIIPFKVVGTPTAKKNAAKGAGLAVAGVAASAGAGKVYRSMVSKSVKYAAMGWRAHDVADKILKIPLRTHSLAGASARARGAQRLMTKSAEWMAKGARIGRLAPAVRIGGIAAGSALIGAGVAKAYKAGRKKTKKGESAAVGATIGTAAFLGGAYGAAGVRQAIKPLYAKAYPAIRAFKGKWNL